MAWYGFDENAARRIAAAVRWVERQQARRPHRGRESVPAPGRWTVAFRNASGETVPEGGLVWLVDADDEATLVGRKVEYPGVTGLGVATADVPPDGEGRAYVSAVRPVPVRVESADFDSIAVGDTLDAVAGRWTARKFPLGGFLVLAKLDSPFVLVRWGERRT